MRAPVTKFGHKSQDHARRSHNRPLAALRVLADPSTDEPKIELL
jgi:hypothetical protein